ncbi:MAG TPA: hypothetical protein VLS91_06055 [Acidimicrobiales bacterium]|nr:hypothetical protein [Acidimicrobiales bacterium]
MSRLRRASAVAVAACLTLGVGVTAVGASQLTVSDSLVGSLTAHGTSTHKTYAQLVADYQSSLTRINHSYGERINQARAKYLKSLAKAKSASDKLHARTKYRTAVVAATTEREVELEILGSPPGSDQSPGDGQSTSPSDN